MRSIFVLLCVLLCCIKCNRDIMNESNDSIYENKQYRLFQNTSLEDSLMNFISSIDSMPNPWGLSPEYLVQFERDNNCDIILIFAASIEFAPINEFNAYWNNKQQSLILLGGLSVCKKDIMVRSERIELDSLIYIQNLDKSLGYKLDSVRQAVNDNPCGWEAPFYRTEKKYKFMYPDVLLLLEYYHLGKKIY